MQKYLSKKTLYVVVAFFICGLLASCSHMNYHLTGSSENYKPNMNRKVAGQLPSPRIISVIEKNIGQLEIKWEGVSEADFYYIAVGGVARDTAWIDKNLRVIVLKDQRVNSQGKYVVTMKAKGTSPGIYTSDLSEEFIIDGSSSQSTQAASPVAASAPVSSTGSSGGDQVDVTPLGPCLDKRNTCPGYSDTLTFSDDFKGTQLNPENWHTQLRWDGEFNGSRYEYRVINGEAQFYVNPYTPDTEHRNSVLRNHNPFELGGGTLKIKAKKNPFRTSYKNNAYGSFDEMYKQQPFLSGAISTHDGKFSQRFGYFEARIKLPKKMGTFPAFWLHHQPHIEREGTLKTEIDVMEHLGHKSLPGNEPDAVYTSLHVTDSLASTGNDKSTSMYKPTLLNSDGSFKLYDNGLPMISNQIILKEGNDYQIFGGKFHVYSVRWVHGKITWYIDGNPVSQVVSNKANHEDLYILLNLAMGGNWGNGAIEGGGMGRESWNRFPVEQELNEYGEAVMEIDYVKAWELNN